MAQEHVQRYTVRTVAELELKMKETFSVAKDAECRVWHRYMTDTYELLNNSSQTLTDAGLYNGQVSKRSV